MAAAADLLDVSLLDTTAATTSLRARLAAGPLVVVFLRHFG
ncbi:MAG: hypothetical protein RL398_952 [Planctomycetota bacterium]|jgi:hypothetical protein